MARLNCPLSTIPGFGLVFTAGILAEIGNIHDFPDDDALAGQGTNH
jgi:hypothetical protein